MDAPPTFQELNPKTPLQDRNFNLYESSRTSDEQLQSASIDFIYRTRARSLNPNGRNLKWFQSSAKLEIGLPVADIVENTGVVNTPYHLDDSTRLPLMTHNHREFIAQSPGIQDIVTSSLDPLPQSEAPPKETRPSESEFRPRKSSFFKPRRTPANVFHPNRGQTSTSIPSRDILRSRRRSFSTLVMRLFSRFRH
ncbi:hypothetical protein M408DRAFT_296751 [Serendipita vermifera MAFF 305830]|uniref:Uncharacterized protein n=1 Tax=Serendipita vermifera MAFF 305830 TaxID=933852 RepID=A0A0C2XMX7_SERVB|nr:hypothetical protein M408DRAFT_296751 [Serendipita vermifera MAFF 305830]